MATNQTDSKQRDWREPLLGGRSKAERVADALEARVRSEGLAPGAFLGTKAALRGELQVSPATLDTALGVLTDRGVIEVRQGVKGGVRVAQPTPALWMGRSRFPLSGDTTGVRAGQAMTLYMALQPHVVARATHALTDTDRTHLTEARARLLDSVDAPHHYHEAHRRAHRALYDASHDDVLIAVMGLVVSILDDETGHGQPPTTEDITTYTKERVQVHVGIIDAVLDGDLDAAWRWLLQHGLTPTDVQADIAVIPPGALTLQHQWHRSFTHQPPPPNQP